MKCVSKADDQVCYQEAPAMLGFYRLGLFDACPRSHCCEHTATPVGRRRISLEGGNRGVLRGGWNFGELWRLMARHAQRRERKAAQTGCRGSAAAVRKWLGLWRVRAKWTCESGQGAKGTNAQSWAALPQSRRLVFRPQNAS